MVVDADYAVVVSCQKVGFCRVVINAFDAIRLGKEFFLHAFVRYIFVSVNIYNIIGGDIRLLRIPSRRKIRDSGVRVR